MNSSDTDSIQNLKLRIEKLPSGDCFALLRDVAGMLADPSTSPAGIDLVIRLCEHRDALGEYGLILDGLLRQSGLFPYLDETSLGTADLLAYETHRPPNIDYVVFHRVQAQIFRRLMAGERIALSAPTSFGKSLIIDGVLASGKFSNVVIIVPTIALIDETRRRLTRFQPDYKIITHPTQQRKAKNIFVLTQERAIVKYPVL